ncbi:MAG TPA: AAA family ATPase [Burkholderiales bacterium]|nr:AAA family ATPase [Burkholderiales bacterium]
MYLSHYGLSEPPFRITPVTDFFYGGANRAAILEALIYAITRGEGIIKVVGEVGTGKTMMCRVLMERLPQHVDTIYLADPTLSREEILYAIADDLGVDLAGQRATVALRALQEALIQRFSAGRRVVLLVDEAHAMPVQTLEEVRLLSNLETSRDKLLQIVLFGQPELDEKLRRPELRQLKDRVIHNFNMQPLEQDAVKDYIAFRMRAAGYKGPDVFAHGALRLIARASQGLTRRINILADKALLAAFVANTHGVESRHVRKAIQDSEFEVPRQRFPLRHALGAAGVAGIAVMAAGLGWFVATRVPVQPAPPPPTPAAAAAQPAAPAPLPPTPTPEAPVPANPAPATASAQSAALPPTPTPSAPNTAPAPDASSAGTLAAPHTGAAAPATVAQRHQEEAAGQIPEAREESAPHPLFQKRLAATREMMESTDSGRFTIHFFYTHDTGPDRIEAFLGRAARSVDLSRIYVLSGRAAKATRYRVFYGSFPTRDEAAAALAQLPEEYRKDFRLQIYTLREMRRTT